VESIVATKELLENNQTPAAMEMVVKTNDQSISTIGKGHLIAKA
jgi:hypothetical protein